jgi:hypothetical protein
MRGAVLYKMGMNMVKERVMRRHYGLVISDIFREDFDPEELKFRGKDGSWRVKNVLHWFVNKVRSVLSRSHFRALKLQIDMSLNTLFQSNSLLSSMNDQARYTIKLIFWLAKLTGRLTTLIRVLLLFFVLTIGVATICSIDVDLRKLPVAAFKKSTATGVTLYIAEFELAIAFGPVMEFRLLYQKTLMGSAVAHYQ